MVLPGPVRGQEGVVGRGRALHGPEIIGYLNLIFQVFNCILNNTPGGTSVEVVSQHLQLVSTYHHVIPEHLIVAGPAGALDAIVAQKMVDAFANIVPVELLLFSEYLYWSMGKNLVWCLFCTIVGDLRLIGS